MRKNSVTEVRENDRFFQIGDELINQRNPIGDVKFNFWKYCIKF